MKILTHLRHCLLRISRLAFDTWPRSPFDVPRMKTKASTQDIRDAIRDSRERNG